MNKNFFKQLLQRYTSGKNTADEKSFIDFWFASFKEESKSLDRAQRKSVRNEIYKGIQAKLTRPNTDDEQPVHKKIKRYQFYGYTAAAIILVVGSITLVNSRFFERQHQTALTAGSSISPGGNRAHLSIQGGQTIALDAVQGEIVVGRHIIYRNGKPVFADNKPLKSTLFTLSTPKGGQYQLTLADGSRVWLNAESSISYPLKFEGNTRSVRVQGEAYFEVAHDKAHPFIVETVREKVEVLGTKFNINSYSDEAISYVSLIEGSVRVGLGRQQSHILKPAQEAVISADKLYMRPVEIEEMAAWRRGEFMFNDETLEEVLKKLSRWYNFDYDVDPGLKTLTIWGSISRYAKFEDALRLIKLTDKNIRIRVEGRRVAVMK